MSGAPVAASDLARFRRLCGQFRWLAIFMVVSVGSVFALMYLAAPLALSARSDRLLVPQEMMASLIWIIPAACYLFAVWSIGAAMGQLAKGRLIQPTMSSALRKVGLALGCGGVFTVFLMTNLLRIAGVTEGGYLNFDVGGMTLGMIGGALFLLGRVVDQAARLQSEMDEMI